MSKTFEITFNPNPTQKTFIESRAKADLFSSRMGEGKSAGLAWSVLYHVRNNPGATAAVIRDTAVNLERSTQKEFFKWFPPGIAGSYKEKNKTFTWAEGVAKGEVIFLGLDDPGDASKLMSLELGMFAMDEPAPAVGNVGIDELVFDIAMTRLRQPGINFYAAKLAENNPDESHWTYEKFVAPGTDGFRVHQPGAPENEANLPGGYYEQIRYQLRNRPDLVRRFIDGKFGFQQIGVAVTPEWSDDLHLALGLVPVRGADLVLCWDFGLNPTCIVTQPTPLGDWLVLDSFVGDGIGVKQLIDAQVRPLLADRYRGYRWKHVIDPAGANREQSNSETSAAREIIHSLGGGMRKGPVSFHDARESLRAVLRQVNQGHGVIRVDRDRAREVWHALRGGWHFHVSRTGITSAEPMKNIHSHPGDAMRYGAGVLFPLGKLQKPKRGMARPSQASFFSIPDQRVTERFVRETPGAKIPSQAKVIGG